MIFVYVLVLCRSECDRWVLWNDTFINAVIAMALVSLLASILFYFLQAPDVAMAEAAIGAALTTAIFIIAIKRTNRHGE